MAPVVTHCVHTECYCMVSQLVGTDRWQKPTRNPHYITHPSPGEQVGHQLASFSTNILTRLADDNLLWISNPKIWLREDFISHYDLGQRALTKASTTLILQWAVKPSQLWPLSSDSSVSKHPWWDVCWYMWFEQQSLTEHGWERDRYCLTPWDEHTAE